MSVRLSEKAGYGLGDFAGHLIFDMVVLYLTFFYTDVAGLSAAAVGTMFLITRVADGFIDFAAGVLADRTRTKWGRFRPYILWFALPFSVSGVLVFLVPDTAPEGRLIYAWVTYSLLMASYSFINIPYGALSGVMTGDPIERTIFNGWRMGLARFASIVVSLGAMPLIGFLGRGDQQQGFAMTATLFAVLCAGLFLVTFATTRERVHVDATTKNRLASDLGMLVRNRPWIVLFILGIVLFANMIVALSSTIYFVQYYVGEPRLITTFMSAGAFAAFIGLPFTGLAVRRLGKKRTFIICQAVAAGCMGATYLLAPEHIAGLLALRVTAFTFIWLSSPLLWTMLADAADYGHTHLGVRATGIVFSAATSAHKMGMGFGGAIIGWWLSLHGYVGGGAQTETAVEAIRVLHTLGPALGSLALIIIMAAYPLADRPAPGAGGRSAPNHQANAISS